MFIIYCHTNVKNGKSYIGWSSLTIDQRWKGHLYDSRRGSDALFHKALRKWGTSNDVWQHEVLETVSTSEKAKEAEIAWIKHRRSYAYAEDYHGYNQTWGGEGVYGIRDSLATKQRKSVSQKRRHQEQPLSFETRSQARKKCLPASDVTRSKMSAAKMKPVAQYMDNVLVRIWSSPKFVDEPFRPAAVARAARGACKSHMGFTWKYL